MIKRGTKVFYLSPKVNDGMEIKEGSVVGIGRGKAITISTEAGKTLIVRPECVAETHFELSSFWSTVQTMESTRQKIGTELEQLHALEETLIDKDTKIFAAIDDMYRKRKVLVCSRLR